MELSTSLALGPDIRAKQEKTNAHVANGSTIKFIAEADLPVRTEIHFLFHRSMVASYHQCPAPVLLNSDFIQQMNKCGLNVTMDLYNHTSTIGDDIHSMI